MVKTLSPKQLQAAAWFLSSLAIALAFAAWGQSNLWQLSDLNIYQIFPLTGLMAFSIMWSHYAAAVLRLYSKLDKKILNSYFEITSALVLILILLHPALVSWQLWKDGFGLPPSSELRYVGPALAAYIVIAVISLCVFLLYEFRRLFAERPWWKYVTYASDIAMLLIFFHALKLGSQLQGGWFQKVWWFYGATLIGSISYIYYQKRRQTAIA